MLDVAVPLEGARVSTLDEKGKMWMKLSKSMRTLTRKKRYHLPISPKFFNRPHHILDNFIYDLG